VDTPDEARNKLAVLSRHCEDVGRPFADITRTHFTIWLILAEDDASVRRKVDQCFPAGLDDTWRQAVVAGTPEQIISYFQSSADAGMRYFVVQIVDADDEETIRLLAEAVAPGLAPGPGRQPKLTPPA